MSITVIEKLVDALSIAQNNLASGRYMAHEFGNGSLWDQYDAALSAGRAEIARLKEQPQQPQQPVHLMVGDLTGSYGANDLSREAIFRMAIQFSDSQQHSRDRAVQGFNFSKDGLLSFARALRACEPNYEEAERDRWEAHIRIERQARAACGVAVADSSDAEAMSDATPAPLPYLCISPVCKVDDCSGCNCAISDADMRKYAVRYSFLRTRLLGVDFDWNESGETALVFSWPDVPVGADFDDNIDAAIAKATGEAA